MDTIKELLKHPIAYQPVIAKAFGSVKLAVLWCQIYYWSDKTTDPDGWIYKTREDIFDETGLSRKEQETARRVGAGMGVLESRRMGQPCTVHFRVDIDRTVELVEKWIRENIKDKITGLKIETVQGMPEPKAEKQRNEIMGIFDFWNGQKIVAHRKMTDKIVLKIRTAIKEYSEKEVRKAIENYAAVINGKDFFWTYRWTLPDFLQRGLTRFLETPIENFKIKEIQRPKKIKEFYRGWPMVEKNGKKFVIENGEWLEFAGKKSDIEKKEV